MSLGGHVHHVTPAGRLIAHHGDYPPHWDDPEDLEAPLDEPDAEVHDGRADQWAGLDLCDQPTEPLPAATG